MSQVRLSVTPLEDRTTPSVAAPYAVGVAAGETGDAVVYAADGTESYRVAAPYGSAFTGGVRVTLADVTGDGTADLVTAPGAGTAPTINVYDGADPAHALVASFNAFEASFTGGVNVAAADITGDGFAEVVAGADLGGGPRVVVFDGATIGGTATPATLADFLAIDDSHFRGGVRLALGDIGGDGTADLLVGAGFGGGPRVAVYNGATILSGITRLFNDFFVFEQTLRNGVYVTGGDLDGDGFADLIFGGGPGGGPRVLALSGTGLLAGQGAGSPVLANFFAGDDRNRGGVRVVAKDTDGDGRAEIFTGGGEGESGKVHKFRGNGQQDNAFDDDFGGNTGVFVG